MSLNDSFLALIFGIIQGITEFLPISSTGHLVVFHKFLPSDLLDNLTFDVFLHAGTLLALIIYFYREIFALIKGFFKSFYQLNLRADLAQRLSWFIIIASLPAALAGYFLNDFIENQLRDVIFVIFSLIIVGIIFIIVERNIKALRNIEALNLGDSIAIGLAQVIAFIPGVSRSGITIITGMGKKLTREAAARFAFLLAIPAILGATIKQIAEFGINNLFSELGTVYLVGFAAAGITGFLTIKFLLKFLKNHSLIGFAIYRFILAIILIFIFYLI